MTRLWMQDVLSKDLHLLLFWTDAIKGKKNKKRKKEKKDNTEEIINTPTKKQKLESDGDESDS